MSYEQAMEIFKNRYALTSKETWSECANRVASNVCKDYVSPTLLKEIEEIIRTQKFIPAGRYLANAGKTRMFTNCLALSVEDSKEGWSEALHKSSLALMKQCGVGIDVSKVRHRGAKMVSSGGIASGAVSVLHMINEVAAHIKAGGLRRVALSSSMHWKQRDMEEYLSVKQLTPEQVKAREKDYNYRTSLDNMNISVRLDDEFVKGLEYNDLGIVDLYHKIIDLMVETGEPGLSINLGEYANDIYVNP
jgi:ribonucleoside-diphosphate reductase alpha chain